MVRVDLEPLFQGQMKGAKHKSTEECLQLFNGPRVLGCKTNHGLGVF